MNEPLRPMNLGEILDRAIQIYRAKFLVFTGLAALPASVMLVVHLAVGRWFPTSTSHQASQRGRELLWSSGQSLLLYHVSAFLGLLIMPALVHVASDAVLEGKTSIRAALQFVTSRWKRFLWIAVLKLGAQLVIPEMLSFVFLLLVAIIGYILGAFNGQEQVLLGLFLLGVPIFGSLAFFLWSGSWLSLAIPAAALEGIGGLRALRRSWDLTKGSRFRILVAWFALSGLAVALSVGIQLLFRWLVIGLYPGQHLKINELPAYILAVHVLHFIVSTVIGPIYPIALTLFYYDQRIRQEGYDIERMMETAGMHAPSPPLIAEEPAAPESPQEAGA